MKSESIEDYLKAIFVLQQRAERVKTTALAQHLIVTPGAVTDMLKRLARISPAPIDYKPRKGVRLTNTGQQIALQVIRRHRLLETFLHRVLGYTWDEVHAEADKLEHYISDRLAEAMAEYLNYPMVDPHGDPIPDINGFIDDAPLTTLADTESGETVCIARVDHHRSEMLRYLASIGLWPDTRIRVEHKAPLNGPITIRVTQETGEQLTHSIGFEVAERIYVQPASTESQ